MPHMHFLEHVVEELARFGLLAVFDAFAFAPSSFHVTVSCREVS